MHESIYNLIPEPQYEQEKSARHTSKFKSGSVRLAAPSYTTFPAEETVDGSAASHFRRAGAPMGKVVGPEIDPRRFLKKGEGPKYIVPHEQQNKMYTKAPIVAPSDKPVMGLFTEKDFVKANAIEIANMATRGRKVEPQRATQRTSFGKIPRYLDDVKAQVTAEKQYVEVLNENESRRQAETKKEFVREMPEEQRVKLLAQLKERWEEKHRQFISLPFARDTMMQIARKEAIEKDLKDMEAAIARLDKKVVYIYRDDPYYGDWAKATATKDAQETAKKHQNTTTL